MPSDSHRRSDKEKPEHKENDIYRIIRSVGLNRGIHPFVTFCISIVVARSLGAEGRGEYGLLVAVVGTLPLMVGLGLSSATLFWGARERVDERSLLKTTTLISLLFGVISVSVVVIGWWVQASSFFLPAGLGIAGIAALSVTVFLTVLTRLWSNFLAGYERYAYSTWYFTISVVSQLLFLIVVWRFFSLSLDLAAVGLALQATLLFIVFPFVSKVSLIQVFAAPVLSGRELIQMFRYGIWPYLTGLLGMASVTLVVFLLSGISGFYETGLFTAIAGPARFLLLIAAPLSFILPARTARRVEDNKFPAQVAGALRLIFCLAAMAAVLGALIAPIVVPWLFGEEFARAVKPFQILLVGMVAMAIKNVINQYLVGLGHPGWATAITAFSALATVSLCLALLSEFGALGAAVAVSVAHLSSGIFGVFVFLHFSSLTSGQLLRFKADDWRPLKKLLWLRPNR